MWEVHYRRGDDEPLQPAGYTFLAHAAEELFRVIGDGRTNVDLRLLDAYGPLKEDRERRRQLVSDDVFFASARFAPAALAGHFGVRCRAKEGGPLLDVPSGHWGIDDPRPRIAASAYDPEQPYSYSAPATHWLFVDSKTFSWWMDDVRIELGEKPVWQRAFDPNASIDHWPKPGFHFIPTPSGPVEAPEPEANGRRRGPPVQYDWEAFHREIIRIAHTDPDGLPLKQEDLKKLMLTWCVRHWGKEPSDSHIRDKISAIYEVLPVQK